MNKIKKNKEKLKFFHLLPSKDLGGAETAAQTCKLMDNNDFIFRTYYINKRKMKNKFFEKIICEIFNYSKGLKFFLNQNNLVLISSLWKSSILSLLIKLFIPKTKIILFLHSTKGIHFLDKIFTSFLFLIANEVWADSQATLSIRLEELIFKRKTIKTKKISFLLRNLTPDHSVEKIAFNFIYWGRLHKEKNLTKTIEFFNKFCLIDNKSKLTLIGHDYGMKNKLIKLIKTLKLEKNINILDFMEINKIIKIAKNYSFFIQLSRQEGMAMSVAESMQLGLIPIVTNVGEIKNYCVDNKNSIIFEGYEETFKKVFEVRNNESSYKTISNNAIRTWKNKKLYKDDMYSACKLFCEDNKI